MKTLNLLHAIAVIPAVLILSPRVRIISQVLKLDTNRISIVSISFSFQIRPSMTAASYSIHRSNMCCQDCKLAIQIMTQLNFYDEELLESIDILVL
jgi:hypothetical protein